MSITLRPHQIAASDAVESAFSTGIGRPLVDACVGAGKSLIYAELARRAIRRGERVLVCSHTRELVEQNAAACRSLGLTTGINAAALDEKCWRAPVISAGVQSIFRSPQSFGPIDLLCIDESHLCPHSEAGMYRKLIRGLGPGCRTMGGSGTVFRLQGGSLVEGEDAPFDQVVFRYSVLDGIRDEYLVPVFSVGTDDNMDVNKLRTRQKEFTGESQDEQMIASMDNHIAQMLHHGADRRCWLVFEASTKATIAMSQRMNEWGIPTDYVLASKSAADDARRKGAVEKLRRGQLRALVNISALGTGFDVQEIDMLVMRRRTMSLGLYIQSLGRLLRTVGGTLQKSIAAGKSDGIVLDFAGNIDQHGPLDCIRPMPSKARLVSCDECGKRNAAAAMRCWACDAEMTKNCPACLTSINRGLVVCPSCTYDMRSGGRDAAKPQALLETPSGAALLSSHKAIGSREGGWVGIRKAWDTGAVDDADGQRWELPSPLVAVAAEARWIRAEPLALLIPNGLNRSSAIQVNADGSRLIVPLAARKAA